MSDQFERKILSVLISALSVMSLDPSANPKCRHCGSVDIDNQLRTFFGVFVCAKDKAERPDEYSLLTKTECKEDYLLTECECFMPVFVRLIG